MTNETFGMTFQFAICQHYDLENTISMKRIDKKLLSQFIASKIITATARNEIRRSQSPATARILSPPLPRESLRVVLYIYTVIYYKNSLY
jgi:hypothetical protein